MRGCSALGVFLLVICCGQAWAGRVTGRVTDVGGGRIKAEFPVPVTGNSMMIVLAGDGEAVAGLAIADRCRGDGPYAISGKLQFVSDPEAMCVGKQVYVDAANVTQARSRPQPANAIVQCGTASTLPHPANAPNQDLGLYYYAAGQPVGYGALGLGFDRTIRLGRALGIELDAGITTLGTVNGDQADFPTEYEVLKTATGRVKLDLAPALGLYTAYRWSEAQGGDDNWATLSRRLRDTDFCGPSSLGVGSVMQQGVEYGLTLRPGGSLALSLGYIPIYRSDFGSFGVCDQPAYTGELRFGGGKGGLRIRGIRSQDYWQADLGISIN